MVETDGSGPSLPGADVDVSSPFAVYHELMAQKVREVLLVASAYDAFIMEEDGSLAAKIIHEYHGLNLSMPPRLTHTTSAQHALSLMADKLFDLVIVMPNLSDMAPQDLCVRLKKIVPDLPVIYLAYESDPVTDDGDPDDDGFDATYVWAGDSDLLLALVKHTEDRCNVAADTIRAQVRVLILVEDSPVYRSFLLPLIYREVVHQTQSVLEEGLNEDHRLLKMRARPKILVATSYEQAHAMFLKFQPYVLGVISDTRFPKCGHITADAGAQFLTLVKQAVPHMPLLLLSSEPENRDLAHAIPAQFIDKNAPDFADAVHRFFLNFLGFGDFVFTTADGDEVGRASTFRELEAVLPTIADEPIHYQASRHRFANWFMARSEIGLAEQLSKIDVGDFDSIDALRGFLLNSIHSLRKNRQRGVVVRFARRTYDPAIADFVKIGKASMGGKARGLAFFTTLSQRHPELADRYPGIRIRVPITVSIATDVFDTFLDTNGLRDLDLPAMTDAAIAEHFDRARLPESLTADLIAFVYQVAFPLSVRSSSLLEDARFHPYDGLYQTIMLPNNDPDPAQRLAALAGAIKRVYASIFFQGARTFSRATAMMARQDRMAILIQEIIGRPAGDHFYPTLSGVAKSWNYYPIGDMRPEDGIARIALGLGQTVTDGTGGLRFSPARPSQPPEFTTVDEVLANAQQDFFALALHGDGAPQDGGALVSRDAADAENEPSVRAVSSTYIPDEHRIRDTATAAGHRVVTFAPVLKYDRFPLADILTDLLHMGAEGMGCSVSFEFAVALTASSDEPDDLAVVQMQPMASGEEHAAVHVTDEDREMAVVRANHCLGNGLIRNIHDVVYVAPETFNPADTVAIAAAIGRINAALALDERPCILAGFGRWGTADPWLGIPVDWPAIRQAAVVVEIRSDRLRAEASQGSHFFQRMTAHGLFYLTVDENAEDRVDWQWLAAQQVIAEDNGVVHIRVEHPLVIKADGHHGAGVILPADRLAGLHP